MLKLPNNCRCSGTPGNPHKGMLDELPVFPKNWKTVKATLKKYWYIKYRYYDDNLNTNKQVVIKSGINEFYTLKERQDAVWLLMRDELHELQKKGLNKITNMYSIIAEDELSEFTPFLEALKWAYEKVKISHSSKLTLKSRLKYISIAAKQKHYDQLAVCSIRKKHLVLLLEKVEENNIREGMAWSAHTYNSFRSYLGILYKALEKMEVVPGKLPHLLEIQQPPKKIRDTLTKEQRVEVNKYLFENLYTFWRCMQIFFHAGCREVELLAVKRKDVDIDNNRFKVLVKKRKGGWAEEWRTIKFIVIDLWKELYNMAEDNQYLFHKGLVPGTANKPIRRDQITRRWRVHIKDKFNVTADFYSLKHTNLEEIAKEKGLKAAQEAAGHASPNMTKVYAFGEELREQQREHETLKQSNNKFA